MGMKKDKFEKVVNGVKHVVYPEETKLQIVKELEEGRLSVKEAMSKYEIHRADTIRSWLKKHSESYREQYMRVIYNDAERRQLVYKIESGIMSLEIASKHYRVEQDTIKDWIKLYSCETNNPGAMSKKKSQNPPVSNETKALQDQIAMLKLKVEGLETMIDIAEKELKIDIRKKSGTKQ